MLRVVVDSSALSHGIGDPSTKLLLVMRKGLTNVMKHIRTRRFKICAMGAGKEILVSIRDHGKGVAADMSN